MTPGYYNGFFILFLLAGICLQTATAAAQAGSVHQKADTARLKNLFSAGAGIQHGFIFAHSQEVENTKGSNPTGVEMILSWQRNDPAVWDLCNCFPRKGLLLAYYDYDNKVLGRSVSAAWFLEPSYKMGKNVFFSFRSSAGLSYLTNPFDSIKNPSNRSYSTHISGYLLVGLGLWFRLNDHWWFNTSVNYQHESNGGLKQPNKGINWPTAGVALSYQKKYRPFYTGNRTKEKFWKTYPLRWDAALFGIAKRRLDEHGNSVRLPLVGVMVQAAKQVGRIHNLTFGTEAHWDKSLRVQLKQDSIRAVPARAGVLAGHEFILGKFLFTQRIGVYVFDQTPYYDLMYHRWGIHYRMNRHIGLGFNLLAHRHVADFIDARLVYSFQKK